MKTIRHSVLLGILALATSSAQVYQPQGNAKPARPEVDPFAESSAKPGKDGEPAELGDEATLSVRYVTVSLGRARGGALQSGGRKEAGRHARVVVVIGKKEARQESLTVVRAIGGKRVKSESVAEMIYAAEYEPPELPNTVGVSITPPRSGPDDKTPATVPDSNKLEGAPALDELPPLQTPATPSAWTTRNTGITLEVEATVVPSGAIKVNLLVEQVTHAGNSEHGQGLSKATMPEFENQAITSSVAVQPNQAALVGTINRPPASKVDPESANRVWFAFVTATPVKP